VKRANKNFLARPRNLIAGWAAYDRAISELETALQWPTNASNIYRSDIVKRELKKVYSEKCAFCNQVPKGSPLQVEHFRPKDGIKDEVHSGYYWLGYEWTNLLFACGKCNSTKSTHFQLQAGCVRIENPTINARGNFVLYENTCFSQNIRSEKPTLINPEIDDPDEHLIYLPDGKIWHLTDRGKYSIEKYNLNRDELYLDGRKKILDDIIDKLVKRLERYTNNERSFKEVSIDVIDVIEEDILSPIEKNESYDHFLFTIYSNYMEYILPRFGNEKHRLLLNYNFKQLHRGLKVDLVKSEYEICHSTN
jgi:uncharacterized protein (TIGR02646 family)